MAIRDFTFPEVLGKFGLRIEDVNLFSETPPLPVHEEFAAFGDTQRRPTALAGFDDDPDHPILTDPFRWELLEFTYRRDLDDWRESYIDMVFVRDAERRRLRFYAPQELEMSRGLPNSFGLCILDVSGRQLEGLGVRVANLEQSYGAPSFWASRVVEVAEPGPA
jgi:hypothetical protein